MAVLNRPTTNPPTREATGARSGLLRRVANLALAVAETIILLPVLVAWYLLFRRSPDPP